MQKGGEEKGMPLFARLLRFLDSCLYLLCMLCSNVQFSLPLTFYFWFKFDFARLGSALLLQKLWANCCPNLQKMSWLACVRGQMRWGRCFLGLLPCTLLILPTSFAVTITPVSYFLLSVSTKSNSKIDFMKNKLNLNFY